MSNASAHERGHAQHGRYFCRACADRGDVVPASERFSMGFYAGMLCARCWSLDGRNHGRKFDPADAGERLDPEDP